MHANSKFNEVTIGYKYRQLYEIQSFNVCEFCILFCYMFCRMKRSDWLLMGQDFTVLPTGVMQFLFPCKSLFTRAISVPFLVRFSPFDGCERVNQSRMFRRRSTHQTHSAHSSLIHSITPRKTVGKNFKIQ